MATIDRVMAATDGSARSNRALFWAADLAERFEAELVLLRVIVERSGPGTTPAPADDVDPATAHRDLEKVATEIAGDRGRAKVVVETDPARGIVLAAREEAADVLVVGNAGMSGRKEFLIGNVTNKVSHNCPCTLVIVDTSKETPGMLRRILRRDR